MSDVAAPVEAKHEPARGRPPRRRGWLLVLILLGLTVPVGVYLWNELQRARSTAASGEAWRLEAESLAARLDSLDRQLGQLDGGRRSVDERIGEVASNQRVIRQELLGMGERAATIEDAVARLSDQRLRGETTLRLNEIESLLVLAEQRLLLARDPEGARTALRLAQSALETLDDPLYAGLALPLRAELAQLQQLPTDPLPALRQQLGDLLAAAPSLPRRPLSEAPSSEASGGLGRLGQALGELVRVRRIDASDSTLAGSARAAALEALQLDLRAALAAAESRDPAGLAAALERLTPLFERLFDPADASVRGFAEALAGLDPQALAPRLPALGASLAELRALRGSRLRLQAPEPATDAPRSETATGGADEAATPAEPTVTDNATAPAQAGDVETEAPAEPLELEREDEGPAA